MGIAEDRHLNRASTLLDELTFGGHSHDGAASVLADALAVAEIAGHAIGQLRAREEMGAQMAEAEEKAVFDFLQWLRPQNIYLVEWSSGDAQPEGTLLERWKTERNA